MTGLLGRKIGMTHIYDEHGAITPVTLIAAGPCYVLQVKTKESDGYTAIQLGFADKREKLVNSADRGRFKKAGVKPVRFVKELKIKDTAPYKVGQKLEADVFNKGDFVDVVGTSIGKGFQGGVRRWNWTGGPGGHGSMFRRAIGSIQSGARLGRVTKGHHMAGHMGDEKVTVQNLEVMKVDKENGLIAVKGPVPGHINSFIVLKEAKKRPKGFVKRKVVQQVVKKKSAKAAVAAAAKK
jgi:large subunit ribosomal protein L3